MICARSRSHLLQRRSFFSWFSRGRDTNTGKSSRTDYSDDIKGIRSELVTLNGSLKLLYSQIGGYIGHQARGLEEEVGLAVARYLDYPPEAVNFGYKQMQGRQIFYEVDALIVDGDNQTQYVIEAKSYVRDNDVNSVLERAEKIRYMYPEYQLRLFLGSPKFNYGLRERCLQNGIFPVVLNGSRFEVMKSSDASPKHLSG